jgi:hypothetical protein
MEIVTKLTQESLEDLKHSVTKRFFAAHIPVDEVSFEPDFKDKNCVDINAKLRFNVVDYTTLVALHGDFHAVDIRVGHTVVNKEIQLALILYGVPHEKLNIKTKFEF